MTTRKSKRQKRAGKLAVERTKQEPPGTIRDETDGKMDFGGLPERDFKKNLGGCG